MRDRTEELIRQLEHELIETRNVTIKSDNSLRNLASDIKTIARKQETYERRMLVNSVAAYVLFASLSFAGLLVFFRASIERAELDHELADERRAALQQLVEDLQADIERRQQSEREAYEFFELLVSGRRDEVIERWPTIQGRLLDRATIELFRREVDGIRHDLAGEAWEIGQAHFNAERWEEARDALTRSMAYVEIAPYTPELHFMLAEALYQLDDYVPAVRYYDLAIGADEMTRAESVLAYFHRAESLQRTDREAEALEAYRTFARRFDGHYWAPTARQRIERLESRLAGDD